MKRRSKSYFFLLLILFNLGLVLISPSVNAEGYQLGFADKTRLTLIYEYTNVDNDILEDLADSTEDSIYEDLSKIKEGEKLKMVISNINEKEDYWLLTIELYSGKNLDQRGSDFETKIYKKPEKLADKFLDDDTKDLSPFIPINAKKYLENFEEIVFEDDKYLETEYELSLDDTELTIDYIPFDYPDTFIQEYGDDGILLSFEILYYGEGIFKKELIDSYEDYSVIMYSVSAAIVVLIATISLSVFMIKKKKNEPSDPREEIDKMLDNIK